MSSTTSPSLHRFTPRRALETTSYGYEVIWRPRCMDDCIEAVRWVDCWCPDAAQFILIEAADDLTSASCRNLFEAIDSSRLGRKLRLICTAATLADEKLVEKLQVRDLGVLLDIDGECGLDGLGEKGILGLRLGANSIERGRTGVFALRSRHQVRNAHDLGMRVVASQMPDDVDEAWLFAAGVDYVSKAATGIRPVDVRRLLPRKNTIQRDADPRSF